MRKNFDTTVITSMTLKIAYNSEMRLMCSLGMDDLGNMLMNGQIKMMTKLNHSNLKRTKRIGPLLASSTPSLRGKMVAQLEILVEMEG